MHQGRISLIRRNTPTRSYTLFAWMTECLVLRCHVIVNVLPFNSPIQDISVVTWPFYLVYWSVVNIGVKWIEESHMRNFVCKLLLCVDLRYCISSSVWPCLNEVRHWLRKWSSLKYILPLPAHSFVLCPNFKQNKNSLYSICCTSYNKRFLGWNWEWKSYAIFFWT